MKTKEMIKMVQATQCFKSIFVRNKNFFLVYIFDCHKNFHISIFPNLLKIHLKLKNHSLFQDWRSYVTGLRTLQENLLRL